MSTHAVTRRRTEAEGPSSDDEMEAIEQRIFENTTALGVSDECVGSAPG